MDHENTLIIVITWWTRTWPNRRSCHQNRQLWYSNYGKYETCNDVISITKSILHILKKSLFAQLCLKSRFKIQKQNHLKFSIGVCWGGQTEYTYLFAILWKSQWMNLSWFSSGSIWLDSQLHWWIHLLQSFHVAFSPQSTIIIITLHHHNVTFLTNNNKFIEQALIKFIAQITKPQKGVSPDPRVIWFC